MVHLEYALPAYAAVMSSQRLGLTAAPRTHTYGLIGMCHTIARIVVGRWRVVAYGRRGHDGAKVGPDGEYEQQCEENAEEGGDDGIVAIVVVEDAVVDDERVPVGGDEQQYKDDGQ